MKDLITNDNIYVKNVNNKPVLFIKEGATEKEIATLNKRGINAYANKGMGTPSVREASTNAGGGQPAKPATPSTTPKKKKLY